MGVCGHVGLCESMCDEVCVCVRGRVWGSVCGCVGVGGVACIQMIAAVWCGVVVWVCFAGRVL